MITRLLVAAVGLAILLPTVVLGGELAVHIIVPLVGLVCVTEYAGMAFSDDRVFAAGWLTVITSALYLAALYVPDRLVLVGGTVAIATLIALTLRPGETLEGTADSAGRYLLGALWVALLASLPLLRGLEGGLAWVFLVLAISWLGDTGGYFAGKYFGSHKLYPKVSPKKTWEGVLGGITLATVGTFVVREVGLPQLTVVDCLVLGPVLCLAGVIGDLSESMLKRSFHVKDSGWIMPGHGGLLDRIDSVLFVAPLLLAYAVVVRGVS